VRLFVVVVLGQGNKVGAVVTAYPNLELVAVLDALDLLQLGIGATALAGRGVVLERVAELELRRGLYEFNVERGVERAERYGERVKAFGHKADGLSLLHFFGEGAVARELEVLLGVAYRDLRKVGAACLHRAAQVVGALALQGLLENLVSERVVNLDLYGSAVALRVREDAVAYADVADGILGGVEANRLFFVDGEFALVVGGGGLALFHEVHGDALEGLALFIGDAARDGVGGR